MPGARDGQLRIRRGTDNPPWGLDLYDDSAGLWRDVAYAAGVPVLRGPYVVDYTEIPHDGDTKTLWTPQVGDVLLRLFPDWQTVTQWDHGALVIGQTGLDANQGYVAFGAAGQIGLAASPLAMDTSAAGAGIAASGSGNTIYVPSYIFHTADPMQIAWFDVGPPTGLSPTQGHVELFALVARAVAP